MKWIDVNKRKPALGTEVLIFCQGYSIRGEDYWSHYEKATFTKFPFDRRRRAFVKNDDSSYPWVYRDVTHWMPLPDPPPRISKEKYAFLAGFNYEEGKG